MTEDVTIYVIYLWWEHDSNTSLVQWVMLIISFMLMKRLKNYADIFFVKDTNVLSLNELFNYVIKIKEKDSLYEPLYNLSEEELKVL